MENRMTPNPADARPSVVVSKCLGFDRCRWNGDVLHSDEVDRLRDYVEFNPVCPECETGLGVPRKPIRIVMINGAQRLIQHETERDLTEEMNAFAARFLRGLEAADGFILKDRSPSCGTKDVKVYDSMEKSSPRSSKSAGLFAARVLEGFGHLAVENEGRLMSFSIREHFYIKLFTRARFRALAGSPSAAGLVAFHTRHKYLLMAYNQTALRDMGRTVARAGSVPPDEAVAEYGAHLTRAFRAAPKPAAHINVLNHLMGYFKKGLGPREKKHFLDGIERFREGRIPLSVCTGILGSWIARFDEPYLADQVYLEPYPAGLAEITDSGKGRGKEIFSREKNA